MTEDLAGRPAGTLSRPPVSWQPRRLAAVAPELPPGVAPPGSRGAILRASLGLFAEFGFHGTPVRQIASAVGMNPASLYGHYPSKEHVLAELVLLGHQELHGRLTDALTLAGKTTTARLAALVREHALVHCDYPLLAVVANAELHALSAESAQPAVELRSRCSELLLRALSDGIQAGEFSMTDPVLTAVAIGGHGMHIAHWFVPGGPYDRAQVADTYAQLALRMVGAQAAAEKG